MNYLNKFAFISICVCTFLDSNETADCLQSVKSLKDISRDCVRNLVDRKRTNVFHVVKCLNLPQGLAQILLLGKSSGP